MGENASLQRTSEERDWQRYAEETTATAFGPIGYRLVKELHRCPEQLLERVD